MPMTSLLRATLNYCFYSVSAVWAFFMSRSLVIILLSKDPNSDPVANNAFGLFEVLSVIGMVWIPIALIRARSAFLRRKERNLPLYQDWALLSPSGHCIYFAALLIVPIVVLSVCPKFFDGKFSWCVPMWAGQSFLTLLFCVNITQLCTLSFPAIRSALALVNRDAQPR